MRFADRVMIVTGGAKGIGLGCAEVFAEEAAAVAIIDRDATAGAEATTRLATETGRDVRLYECDVADGKKLAAVINQIAADFGRIDCLINNAGIHPPAMTIEETSPEEAERVMRVNFLSTFVASRAAAPHLKRTSGTIVNISSMTAVLGQEHSTAYSASKAAQVGFTKSLALELGRVGVRVNAILPSNIDTPLMHDWAATLPDPKSALQRVSELQVLNRMGTPREVGTVALFLATEDSSFLTGQAIELDGGAALDY